MERLRQRKINEVEADLQNNPKLLDDPKYLAQHPMLADYLKKNPDAKAKIKQDPKGFFDRLKAERSQRLGG
jgi:hypothetical protein